MKLGLLFACLLVLVACAHSPVVYTHCESGGFTSAKADDADLTIVVSYTVPGVLKDTDTYYFKRSWSKVTEYADGSSTIETDSGEAQEYGEKYLDFPWGTFSDLSGVTLEDAGPTVDLNLYWDGNHPGHLERKFLIRWSELEKTVKDEHVEIHVTLSYSKRSPHW